MSCSCTHAHPPPESQQRQVYYHGEQKKWKGHSEPVDVFGNLRSGPNHLKLQFRDFNPYVLVLQLVRTNSVQDLFQVGPDPAVGVLMMMMVMRMMMMTMMVMRMMMMMMMMMMVVMMRRSRRRRRRIMILLCVCALAASDHLAVDPVGGGEPGAREADVPRVRRRLG
jgi:hypothetical protein